MKISIKLSAIMICSFFIAEKSNAQIKTAVRPVQTVTAKNSTAIKAVPKTSIPDPVAAIASQGIEVVKPVVITVVKLPAVSDQVGKTKE